MQPSAGPGLPSESWGPSGGPAPGPSPMPPQGQPWGPGAGGPGPGPAFPPGGPGIPMGPQPGPPAPAAAVNAWVLARLAGLVGVLLGLSLPFDSSCMWVTSTAWSILAALACVAAVIAGFGVGSNPRTTRGLGLAATAALVVHWVLIALPGVGSNSGFCLTIGTGALVAAAWFSWGRTLR